jgi:hypothetical protein
VKLFALILILFCCSTAVAESGWHRVPAVSQTNISAPMLADILSHVSPGEIHRSSDLVEEAHETTHSLNNRIRASFGGWTGGVNAFYVGDGYAMVLREPRIRKSQVAATVPQSLRGQWFGLYVAGNQAWDGQPLYLLDEMTAYINGAIVGSQVNSDQMRHQLNCSFEFVGYAGALLDTVDRLDPNYPDRKLLGEFVSFNTTRALSLATTIGYVPGNLALLESTYDRQIAALNGSRAKLVRR